MIAGVLLLETVVIGTNNQNKIVQKSKMHIFNYVVVNINNIFHGSYMYVVNFNMFFQTLLFHSSVKTIAILHRRSSHLFCRIFHKNLILLHHCMSL